MKHSVLRRFCHRVFFLGICLPAVAAPAVVDEDRIRAIMQAHQVPGVAIGIIQKDQVLVARGFGYSDLSAQKPVTDQTIFKIASNTKAFTGAALAILNDEGKLDWSDKVRRFIPDFTLYDPWVSAEFNVVDLLTHRSGLGLGAGDLMLWPEPSSFSRQEVIHNLRYLPQSGEFRADYAYDNLLYIVAGELVPAASGIGWEHFVETRIMRPLDMQHCFAGDVAKDKTPFLATPYAVVDRVLQPVVRPQNKVKPHVSAAAGGIRCSASDMLKWIRMLLNHGVKPDGEALISSRQVDRLWQPVTLLPLSDRRKQRDNTHYSAYGLGWRMSDIDGYQRIHHTGSLAGMYSAVSLIPELDLGIVVLTNQQSGRARSALMYTLMKPFLGDSETDWLTVFPPAQGRNEPLQQPAVDSYVLLTDNAQKNKALVGRYQDPWLGEFVIEKTGKTLQMRSIRVERLVGPLYYSDVDKRYMVKWQDRSLEADVYAAFSYDAEGKVKGMRLLPVSDDIDFSYDFQDLKFTRQD